MIKLFRDLSDEDKRKFLSSEFSIIEKLDMIYFRVNVNKLGVFALKTPKYTAVSEIDCICNTVYNNIVQFADSINEIKSDIMNSVGECTIGFFYMPVNKTKVIDYYTLTPGTFVMSDVYTKSKLSLSKDDISDLVYSKISSLNFNILDSPGISIEVAGDDLIDDVIRLFNEGQDDSYIIKMMFSYFDIEAKSGLQYNEIEGIILKNNKAQYQLLANEVDRPVNKDMKKIYRDIILSDLAKEIITDQYIYDMYNSKKTYLEKVCKLFLDFMNKTDVFSKYKFDAEDFLPPIHGYIGDVDVEAIPDEDVKTICKVNSVAKNILRLFLHTFTNPISNNKFKDLNVDDVSALNMLTISLKYKNFAELALNSI